MSIAKVIGIIGSSPESFAKAADAAVQEAAKTVRGIHGAHVISMSATVPYPFDPTREGPPTARQARARIGILKPKATTV